MTTDTMLYAMAAKGVCVAVQAPARTSRGVLSAGQWALLAAVALALAGKGAFYRQGQLMAGGVLGLAVVLAVVAGWRRRVDWRWPRSVSLVVVSLLAFGAWAAARGALAGDGAAGVPVLAFAVALSTGLVMGHRAMPPQREMLRHAVIGLGALSAVVGWAGVVWRLDALALPGPWGWRAAGTLTYENALACLLAMTVVAAVAAMVEREAPAVAVATSLMLAGMAATQSRGGALALLCGGGVLLACLGWRAVVRVAWRPALGGAVAALMLAPSVPAQVPPRPLPAIAGLCAGAAIAAWPRRHVPTRTAAAAGVALLAVATVGGALAVRSDPALASSLERRLTLKSLQSRHRVAQHRVAVAELAAQPVAGTGPGRAQLRWREDGRMLRARFVHNEYLQVAVELGIVGAVLLVTVLVTLAGAVRLGRSAGGPPWAGVAAALAAAAVHGAVDFVWHLPVIPFIAVLLAGTATVPADGAEGA